MRRLVELSMKRRESCGRWGKHITLKSPLMPEQKHKRSSIWKKGENSSCLILYLDIFMREGETSTVSGEKQEIQLLMSVAATPLLDHPVFPD